MSNTQTDHGGPAYPVPHWVHPNGDIYYGENGMTLRDYFAGQVLVGWLASFPTDHNSCALRNDAEVVSKTAYKVADAMLAARKAAR